MKIISFSRTTAALVAGRKSVTRREWSDRHFNSFKVGDLAQAWSASPHRKGRKVGVVLITGLTREPTNQIPDGDWEAEGFAYMVEHDLMVEKELSCVALWERWRNDPELVTAVIRFTVVSIEPGVKPEDLLPGSPQ